MNSGFLSDRYLELAQGQTCIQSCRKSLDSLFWPVPEPGQGHGVLLLPAGQLGCSLLISCALLYIYTNSFCLDSVPFCLLFLE